jgi:hypothetical protein
MEGWEKSKGGEKPDPFYVTVIVKVGPVAVGDIAPPAQTDMFTGVEVAL